jgi:hypothetical protein
MSDRRRSDRRCLQRSCQTRRLPVLFARFPPAQNHRYVEAAARAPSSLFEWARPDSD